MFRFTLKIISLIFVLSLPDFPAEAASKAKLVGKGNAAFQTGEYAQSIQNYQKALEKDSESDIINFNLGSALYKEGDYEGAVQHLHKALLSEEKDIRHKAYYNLGNSHFRLGATQVQSQPDSAIEAWESALKYYQQALDLQKDDANARHNHDYVQRKLEELKQQQKQQQNQNQQQQQDQPSDGDKQEEKDSGDNQQNDSQDQNQQQNQEQNQNQDQQGSESQQQDQPQQQDSQQSDSSDQSGKEDQSSEEDGEEQRVNSEGPSEDQDESERASGKEQDGAEQEKVQQQPLKAGQLTPQEARMLLEQYQQSQEPKGLLNVYQKQKSSPVRKDW